MGPGELEQWATYMRRHGPLNPVRQLSRKIDYGFAMLAMLLCRVNGSKDVKVADFLPGEYAEEAENPDDPEAAVLGMLQGLSRAPAEDEPVRRVKWRRV